MASRCKAVLEDGGGKKQRKGVAAKGARRRKRRRSLVRPDQSRSLGGNHRWQRVPSRHLDGTPARTRKHTCSRSVIRCQPQPSEMDDPPGRNADPAENTAKSAFGPRHRGSGYSNPRDGTPRISGSLLLLSPSPHTCAWSSRRAALQGPRQPMLISDDCRQLMT